MLELEQPGHRKWKARGVGSWPALGHVERLAFGGVAFELLSTAPLQREGEAERYCLPPSAHPVLADVLCAVSIDAPCFEGSSPFGPLEIERAGDGEILLRAPRVLASLREVGPSRYACSARIAQHPSALSSLLRSISAVILQAHGGVIVHAAGIELDGRAILYTGPSGAGKSTAAALTEGATMFAHDHVALVARDATVMAYGLPGGASARMTQTCDVVLPLAGVFRIRRGEAVARGERLQGARALFALRESVESADVSMHDEQARLQAVSAIAASANVGTLFTVLGKPLASIVRALSEGST